MTAHRVLHVPQDFRAITRKVLTISFEIAVVPAVLLAYFGSHGQLTYGIISVFIWRTMVGMTRFYFFGPLPVTSIFALIILVAKTGASEALTMAGGNPLLLYLLPGCSVAVLSGCYFVWSSKKNEPLVMKLAGDFVVLEDQARQELKALFQRITLFIGACRIIFGGLGTAVVLSTDPRTASVLSSGLSLVGPVLTAVATVAGSLLLLRKHNLRVCLRAKPPVALAQVALASA